MRHSTLINLIKNSEVSQEAKDFAMKMVTLKSVVCESDYNNQLKGTIIQILKDTNIPLRVKDIQAQIYPKVSIQKITGALNQMRRRGLFNARIKRTTKEDCVIMPNSNITAGRIFSISQPKPITRTIAFYSIEPLK
jgi:hypothetical protein